MTDINAQAAAAREAARSDTGQFGTQTRTAPDAGGRGTGNQQPLYRSDALYFARRRAESFRRAAEQLEDLELRHTIANIVHGLPREAAFIQVDHDDEEVDEFGGDGITLSKVTDVNGNELDNLYGSITWSSRFGTGGVWSGDWVDGDDRLDLDKVRAWAREADGTGLEARDIAFDAIYDQGEDNQETIRAFASRGGYGVATIGRRDFESDRYLSQDEWDRIRPQLTDYDEWLRNSGAYDSMLYYRDEAADRAGVQLDDTDEDDD